MKNQGRYHHLRVDWVGESSTQSITLCGVEGEDIGTGQTPALPFLERWGAVKLRPVCTPSPSSYSPGKRTIQRSGRRRSCSK